MAPAPHHTEHVIDIAAPVPVVFDLLADVSRWPCLFGPTVHAEPITRRGGHETLRLWALANDQVRDWTSQRQLDPEAGRIRFAQQQPQAPVASMAGEWILSPCGDDITRVLLTHDYTVVDDDPEAAGWLATAVEQNSTRELAALREAAESSAPFTERFIEFEDTVTIHSGAGPVFDFLYRAEHWPDRLDHVAAVELRDLTPDRQLLRMDTRAPDGTVHRTTSYRVGFAPDRLVYKQVELPRLLRAHAGEWVLTRTDAGVTLTSRHRVVVHAEAVTEVLGPDATLAGALTAAREALSGNSRRTMTAAKAFAEALARDDERV